ncbi:carboxylesterase family protein [Nocardia sp. NPDC059239]|uniref:carboxylesterase family protein n=1 Tax=Nocardia sp. NPDC059239 TaxID=3346785 RepID=UPI0036AA82D5
MRIASIRYARAGRFEPPQMSTDTVASSSQICPQLPQRLGAVMGTSKAELPQGEDCLNLSITTPGCDDAARPVMVFFHGGAFSSGAGLSDWYDGSVLSADADVVVVSVNYRLGVFGFLCLDGVSDANLGLLDQVEALRWVQTNIRGYGGDPNRVTVFGQSAGALSIRLLMEIPAARGLFTRAILQSGPAPRPTRARQDAQKIGEIFIEKLGVDPRAAPVAAMLDAAARTATELASAGGVALPPFYPVSGAEPLHTLGASLADNVTGLDVLCGWNLDDTSAFTATAPGPETLELTEQLLAQPVRAFAAELDDAGARVHIYRFDWRPEGSAFGATHGVELPLLLGTRQAWQPAPMLGTTTWTDIERLGAQLRRVWGYFARTGHIDTESPTALPMIWGPGRAAPR